MQFVPFCTFLFIFFYQDKVIIMAKFIGWNGLAGAYIFHFVVEHNDFYKN